MKKNKIFALLVVMVMALTSIFSVNVFAIESSNNTNLTVNYGDGAITVEGVASSGEYDLITLRIFRPDRSILVIDQIESEDDGSFSYVYPLENAMKGTYQVLTSFQGSSENQKTTFSIGRETSTSDVVLEQSIIDLDTETYVTFDIPSYTYDENSDFPLDVTIENNDSNQHSINVVGAFYDLSGEMVNLFSTSFDVPSETTRNFKTTISMSDIIKDTTLKIFAIEGREVYNGSATPITYAEILNYSPYADSSSVVPEENDIRQPGKWVYVEPSDTDDVSVVPDIEIEETYSYNGIYCERVVHDNTQFTATVHVKNKTNSSYWFAYIVSRDDDPDHGIFMGPKTLVKGKEEIDMTVSYDSKYLTYFEDEEHQPEPTNGWEPATLGSDIPFEKYIGNDFFNGDFDVATLLPNYTLPVEGRINSESDVDFVKFTPTESGKHVFQFDSDPLSARGVIIYQGTSLSLYDANKQLIKTSNRSFATELQANQLYYIKLSGDMVINYKFQIKRVSNYHELKIPCLAGDYVSIPLAASSSIDLSNTEFAVVYFSDDFELYSACEDSSIRVLDIGELTENQLVVTDVNNNGVSFKSTKAASEQPCIVNTVKLKALKTGDLSVICYTK